MTGGLHQPQEHCVYGNLPQTLCMFAGISEESPQQPPPAVMTQQPGGLAGQRNRGCRHSLLPKLLTQDTLFYAVSLLAGISEESLQQPPPTETHQRPGASGSQASSSQTDGTAAAAAAPASGQRLEAAGEEREDGFFAGLAAADELQEVPGRRATEGDDMPAQQTAEPSGSVLPAAAAGASAHTVGGSGAAAEGPGNCVADDTAALDVYADAAYWHDPGTVSHPPRPPPQTHPSQNAECRHGIALQTIRLVRTTYAALSAGAATDSTQTMSQAGG